MPSKKADPFHWDSLVRLTHWGVAAICIGNLWLNEAGEEWHVADIVEEAGSAGSRLKGRC